MHGKPKSASLPPSPVLRGVEGEGAMSGGIRVTHLLAFSFFSFYFWTQQLLTCHIWIPNNRQKGRRMLAFPFRQWLWQALTIRICKAMKTGAKISEYENVLSLFSFWHKSILKINKHTKSTAELRNRSPASLYSCSLYIRINTIVEKYMFNPSQANNGINTVHHVEFSTSWYFRTPKMENTKSATKCSQISKAVIPSHLIISFNVKSILSCRFLGQVSVVLLNLQKEEKKGFKTCKVIWTSSFVQFFFFQLTNTTIQSLLSVLRTNDSHTNELRGLISVEAARLSKQVWPPPPQEKPLFGCCLCVCVAILSLWWYLRWLGRGTWVLLLVYNDNGT